MVMSEKLQRFKIEAFAQVIHNHITKSWMLNVGQEAKRNMAELAPGCSVLLLVSTLSKIDFTLIDDFYATDAKFINSDLDKTY